MNAKAVSGIRKQTKKVSLWFLMTISKTAVAVAPPPDAIPLSNNNFFDIANDLSASYQMIENVRLDGGLSIRDRWVPPDASFTGKLYGNNFTLSHYITSVIDTPYGLFRSMVNAYVADLIVHEFQPFGRPAGALAGHGENTTVENIVITRRMIRGQYPNGDGAEAGALFGSGNNLTLRNIVWATHVTGGTGSSRSGGPPVYRGGHAGGLVGTGSNIQIHDVLLIGKPYYFGSSKFREGFVEGGEGGTGIVFADDRQQSGVGGKAGALVGTGQNIHAYNILVFTDLKGGAGGAVSTVGFNVEPRVGDFGPGGNAGSLFGQATDSSATNVLILVK